MNQGIVCMQNVRRYYGDKPELVAKYQQIVESDNCPFCEPYIKNERVHTGAGWVTVKNQFPYKNTRLHLLILPFRHIVSPLEMSGHEWDGFRSELDHAYRMFSELRDGFGLALRVGEVGGVTLTHLHYHLILPEMGENGQIPVNFGIG